MSQSRSTCSRACTKQGIAYTFRGSEFGMCFHRHIACLRGLAEASVDAKTRLYFTAGNEGEAIAKDLLHDLAAKHPGLQVVEYATGWQNQVSVQLDEKRFIDEDEAAGNEVRLVCSPDGRLAGDVGSIFAEAGWLRGHVVEGGKPSPNDWALEVKVYGDTSERKFIKHGAAAFPTLEWQTSGVAGGYARRLGRPVGVACLILRREPIRDDEGKIVGYTVPKDQIPSVWLYDQPKYTAKECLDRCWEIVDAYEQHKWIPCDNAYFCRYPHRPTPVIDSIGEAMMEALISAWVAYQEALRDVEGLLIGAKNGDVVHGHVVGRQLLSLPLVKPLGS